jgi:hypothetical protein
MSLSKGKGIATSPSPTLSIHSTSFNLCQASTKYSRAEQMTILSGFFDKQNSALAETLQDETTAKETPSHTIGKHGLWHRFAQSLVRAAYKRCADTQQSAKLTKQSGSGQLPTTQRASLPGDLKFREGAWLCAKRYVGCQAS